MRSRQIWFVDFEYYQPDGELPSPLCLVAHEKYSGQWSRLSGGEFPNTPPYSVAGDSIFVAYAADAELLCHRALGWSFPEKVIDLHVEYLNFSNQLERSSSQVDDSLLAVLAQFKIEHITSTEKDRMREVAMSGGPRTAQEAAELLAYCETDVAPLPKLYDKLIGPGNVAQALERGRYIRSVAAIQATGTPMDVAKLDEFRAKWEQLKWRLVDEVDRDFGCYNGAKFSHDKFKAYVARNRMSWPASDSGLLKTDKDTFKERASLYPEVAALHELKSTLGLMKRESLSIGHDGRNRCSLHPFRSKTGRNQPSASRFIFSAPSWMRSFVKPAPGRAISYIDYEQQEFIVGAALSCTKKCGKRTRAATRILRLLRWQAHCQPTRLKRHIREFESCSKHARSGSSTVCNRPGWRTDWRDPRVKRVL